MKESTGLPFLNITTKGTEETYFKVIIESSIWMIRCIVWPRMDTCPRQL